MPAALRAELTGLKPRALLKRAEAMGVNEDALDEAEDASATIELILARTEELAAVAAPPAAVVAAAVAADGAPEGGAVRTAARAAKRKKKGQQQLANGDPKAALATFEAALALAPGDTELVSLKATAAGNSPIVSLISLRSLSWFLSLISHCSHVSQASSASQRRNALRRRRSCGANRRLPSAPSYRRTSPKRADGTPS